MTRRCPRRSGRPRRPDPGQHGSSSFSPSAASRPSGTSRATWSCRSRSSQRSRRPRHSSIACSSRRWCASRTTLSGWPTVPPLCRGRVGWLGRCSSSAARQAVAGLSPRLSWQTTRLVALTAVVAVGAQLMAPVRFRAYQGDTMVGDVNGLLNSGTASLRILANVYYPWDIWTAALLLLLIATALRLRQSMPQSLVAYAALFLRRIAEPRDDHPDRAVQPVGAGAAGDARATGGFAVLQAVFVDRDPRIRRVDHGRASQPEAQSAGRRGVVTSGRTCGR